MAAAVAVRASARCGCPRRQHSARTARAARPRANRHQGSHCHHRRHRRQRPHRQRRPRWWWTTTCCTPRASRRSTSRARCAGGLPATTARTGARRLCGSATSASIPPWIPSTASRTCLCTSRARGGCSCSGARASWTSSGPCSRSCCGLQWAGRAHTSRWCQCSRTLDRPDRRPPRRPPRRTAVRTVQSPGALAPPRRVCAPRPLQPTARA
mmetsp:Transcript_615/g.1602  ORF Transcript_615/g.1602 Transcript_615/m.1602 type:complete len:211 (+) Transcript_615:946-1578(+)